MRGADDADRGEKWLLRAVKILLALLCASQIFMMNEQSRFYLSRVDQLEGRRISADTPVYAAAAPPRAPAATAGALRRLLRRSETIVIKMVEPASSGAVLVRVNGRAAADFRAGGVRLTVFEGDYIEIDAAGCAAAVRFIVRAPDGGVAEPADGLMLEGKGNVVPVGKVWFK